GYLGDKLDIPNQSVSVDGVEERLKVSDQDRQIAADLRKLFEELDLGRFAKVEKGREDMKAVYELAERVISSFEKVKFK
ncbi:MAG: hypothetical protein HYZ87_04740, partial [Candidatus Omnitrophica bacterium]|nr:hypothetical protein [Candidatus Omnitrophota bacterium]